MKPAKTAMCETPNITFLVSFLYQKQLSFKEQDDSRQWTGKDAKMTMASFKILFWSRPQQTKENHIKFPSSCATKIKRRYPNHDNIFGIISPLLMI